MSEYTRILVLLTVVAFALLYFSTRPGKKHRRNRLWRDREVITTPPKADERSSIELFHNIMDKRHLP